MVDTNALNEAISAAQSMSYQNGLDFGRYISILSKLWELGLIYIIIFIVEVYLIKRYIVENYLHLEGMIAWAISIIATALFIFPISAAIVFTVVAGLIK